MKIQVRVKLSLPIKKTRLAIQYKIFEKATFDQYLIAAIVKNTSFDEEAIKYIDDITGKGSLNSYYKNRYNDIVEMDKDSINRIINDSMYPKLKFDESNVFVFFKDLNISKLGNSIFDGDALLDRQIIESLIPESGEFYKSEIIKQNEEELVDSYDVIFDNDTVKVKIGNKWVNVDSNVFQIRVINDIDSIEQYKGSINNQFDNSQWNLLFKSKLNNVVKADMFYYHNGDHYQITNSRMIITKIASFRGLFWYKEEIIEYTNHNKNYCEDILDYLMESSKINEFKTKALIKLLEIVDDVDARKYINYLLERKFSSEIAKVGLKIIRNGLEIGWNHEACKQIFKEVVDFRDLQLIYKIDHNLDYDIFQLLEIYNSNKSELSQEDRKKVELYLENRRSIIDQCNKILGEITSSGYREKTKTIKGDDDVAKYRKLANKYQGHGKKNIENLYGEQLEKYHKDMIEFYRLHNVMKQKI